MPKAKPVSLHPLTFDEAISAIIGVDPTLSKNKSKKSPAKPKRPAKG